MCLTDGKNLVVCEKRNNPFNAELEFNLKYT